MKIPNKSEESNEESDSSSDSDESTSDSSSESSTPEDGHTEESDSDSDDQLLLQEYERLKQEREYKKRLEVSHHFLSFHLLSFFNTGRGTEES